MVGKYGGLGEVTMIIHNKNRTVIMTRTLSFWLQMSEPITHMDTDNCITIHHKEQVTSIPPHI